MLPRWIRTLPDIKEIQEPFQRLHNLVRLLAHLLHVVTPDAGPEEPLGPITLVNQHANVFTQPKRILGAIHQRNLAQRIEPLRPGEIQPTDPELLIVATAITTGIQELLTDVPADLAAIVRDGHNTATDPWTNVSANYKKGQRIFGTVKGRTEHAVFVELEPGVDGIVPLSELADQRVEDASALAEIGQRLELLILLVECSRCRIVLSHKRLKNIAKPTPPPESSTTSTCGGTQPHSLRPIPTSDSVTGPSVTVDEAVAPTLDSSAVSPQAILIAVLLALLPLSYFTWQVLGSPRVPIAIFAPTPNLTSGGDQPPASSSVVLSSQPVSPPPSRESTTAVPTEVSAPPAISSRSPAITTPYSEIFLNAEEGYLPHGWTGDDFIVVRKSAGLSWLESSLEMPQTANVPLSIHADFELELSVSCSSSAALQLTLGGPSPLHINLSASSTRWTVWVGEAPTSRFSRRGHALEETMFSDELSVLRIVRVGRLCYVCFQSQQLVLQRALAEESFESLNLTFTGTPRALKVFGVSLATHPRPREYHPLPFARSFSDAAEGPIPTPFVADRPEFLIIRKQAPFGWVERMDNDPDRRYRLATPPLELGDNFTIEMTLTMPGYATCLVALRGIGTSADLPLFITNRHREYQISVPPAAPASTRIAVPESRVTLQLLRTGSVFKVVRSGETILIGPRLDDLEFDGVSIGFAPGVRLHHFAVWTPQHPLPKTLARPDSWITGDWYLDNDAMISLNEKSDVVEVSLVKSKTALSGKAVLKKNSDTRYSGTLIAVLKDDPTRSDRAIHMDIAFADEGTAHIRFSNWPVFDRAGRMRTQDVTEVFKRRE